MKSDFQKQRAQYRPTSVKAMSWDEIELHYVDLVRLGWRHEGFVALIKHIKSSALSERLFAYTGMDTLNISIYNPIEWNREVLRIEYDQPSAYWYFTYCSLPFQPTLERKYPSNLGIERFDNFIKMIGW